MNGELDRLIKFVSANVVFDERNYPALAGASNEEKLLFALNHSALHFAKTAGKIAEVSESIDHGGEADIEALKKQVWKSMINTLWLAQKIGMTEKEILAAIEKKYTK